MNKQIEKMAMTPLDILANDINQHCPDLKDNYCGDTHCVACLANSLYNAGYRKQTEGEWKVYFDGKELMCSSCKATFWDEDGNGGTNFCPECGAKMKGEETPKKIFSPEEVRKMSPREVRDNYGAIMESMKGW